MPAPVLVLVLVVIFQKRHAARPAGKHRTGAHVEDAATAGAGPAGVGRQRRGQRRRGPKTARPARPALPGAARQTIIFFFGSDFLKLHVNCSKLRTHRVSGGSK
jgi:hypothetical protein